MLDVSLNFRPSFIRFIFVLVLFATRAAVIAADVLVLLITWQKTWDIVRQSADLEERMALSEVLLRDGQSEYRHSCNSMLIAVDIANRDGLLLVSKIEVEADLEIDLDV